MERVKHFAYTGNYIDEGILKAFTRTEFIEKYPLYDLFRKAVRHHSWGIRQQLKDELKDTDLTLDHHPVPFSALMRVFLKLQGLDPDCFRRTDITVDLMQQWQHFHGDIAEYRLLSATHNDLLGRCYRDYMKGLSVF